jgi:hypothetical protein
VKQIVGMLLVQLGVLLAGGGAAVASPAMPVNPAGSPNPAGSASPAGTVRFLVAGRVEDPSATVVASGAITGIGSLTAESVDFRPSDNTYRETDLLAIGGGTLTVSIDGAFDVWPFTLDPRTCTQRGTLAGTWIVTAGGGDLTGTTGDGTFSGRFFTYAPRGPAGCDDTTIKGFILGPMVGDLNLADTRAG